MTTEKVVAESVVVLKKLLQMKPEAHKDIIVSMSKMANRLVIHNSYHGTLTSF